MALKLYSCYVPRIEILGYHMGRGAASFYEGNRKGIGKWRAEIAGGGRKRETGNRKPEYGKIYGGETSVSACSHFCL